MHVYAHVLPVLLHVGYYRLHYSVQFQVLPQIPPRQNVIPTQGAIRRFLEPAVAFGTLLAEYVPAVPHAARLVKNLQTYGTLQEIENSIDSLAT